MRRRRFELEKIGREEVRRREGENSSRLRVIIRVVQIAIICHDDVIVL